MIGEIEGRRRIRFAAFWARRFKRLMPLLVVTVAGTFAAGLLIYSPLFWQQLAREGMASTLYVSNIHFARDSSFYFRNSTSPFLHMWSLSVEEQFYAAWPLVFAVVGFAAHRFGRSLRRSLWWAILAVCVGSFALGWLFTRRGSPWAFFSSPTRAWEFGLGALTFLAAGRFGLLRTRWRTAAGVTGLLAVLIAALTFDQFTEMPGTAALLPVAGTALVLLAGTAPGRGVGALLALAPLRSLGRVSYGWYLFHWPAVVLVAAAMQRSSIPAAAVASIASLGLAYLATWAIERPVRRSVRFTRPRMVLVAAGLAAALLVTSGLVIEQRAQHELADPYLASLVAVRDGRSVSGSGECVPQTLSGGMSICAYGNPDSATTVVLMGDSHAAQWSPAMELAAQRLAVRLVVQSRGGCPALPVFIARSGDDRVSYACLSHREESARLLAELDPALVVVANADYTTRMLAAPEGWFLDRGEALAAWSDGAAVFATEIASLGSRLAVIEDNPSQQREPIECLARHRSVEFCSVSAARAVPPVEEIAAAEQGAFESVAPITVLRTIPMICDAERCLVERDGVTVYSDSGHLSRAFVLQQADAIEAFLSAALAAGR